VEPPATLDDRRRAVGHVVTVMTEIHVLFLGQDQP
jgi:hypothetical protein